MSESAPVLAGFRHFVPIIGCTFMEGVSEAGERILALVQENPDRVPGFPIQGVAKETLETFHLASYAADYALHHGRLPFESVTRGNDPPDFVVEVEGASTGVDLAVLADSHRRLAHKLLAHLRERLVAGAGGRNFTGIGGCMVVLWFGPHLTDLPPARWDESVVEPLLDELAVARVDRAALAEFHAEVAQRGFPEVWPPAVAAGRIGDDAAGFVANVVGPEDTIFPNGLPFDVQLHRPRDATAGQLVQAVIDVIDSHDKPMIEHLILSAGAPDRSGWRYPAEEAVAQFVVKQPGLVIRTKFIRRVTVHSWFGHTLNDLAIEDQSEASAP